MTHGWSSRGSGKLRTLESLEARTLFSDITFQHADFNDIAYDSTGALHVAYYDTSTQKLMYAVKPNGGSWSTPISITSATGVGTYVSMAVDSTNGVGVVYADETNTDLLYAYKPSGGSWPTTASTIRTSYCMYPSLTFNTSNQAVVSYYLSTTDDLVVSTKITSGWATQPVEIDGDVGRWSSLARIANTDLFGVAYEDTTNHTVKYRRQTAPGVWSAAETVDSTLAGGTAYLSLAFNNETTPLPTLAYYDTTNADLCIGVRGASAWSRGETITKKSIWQNLIFDPTDSKFHLIYQDFNADNVSYLWGSGTSWSDGVLHNDGGYRVSATLLSGTMAYAHIEEGTGVLAIDHRPSSLIKRPTNLAVTGSSAGQVSLLWSEDIPAETGFKVERSEDAGLHWTHITTTVANVTSYTDPNAVGGKTYYYQVQAYKGVGTSVYSNFVSVTTPEPSAPSSLTATATSPTAISLLWSNVAGESGYVVERRVTGTQTWSSVAVLQLQRESDR